MSDQPRMIAIMGSGETAPTMMKHHRDLMKRLGPAPAALILDTPYGFQENAPELAHKAVEYFRQSVGFPIEVAGLTRLIDADPLLLEQGLNRLRNADYVFAGPGSPTYALRQWADSSVPDLVRAKLRSGGIVTFASAAALTLGRFTVPVYEIYKVGFEPHWLDGLDLLSEAGLDVAVIPHYDNAEGGHHDSRYCYLGERRLVIMEEMLPAETHVIGIDEHTGVIIDIDGETATVVGNGRLTVRIRGRSVVHDTGAVLPLDALRDPSISSHVPTRSTTIQLRSVDDSSDDASSSLADDIESCEVAFDLALANSDAPGAARATLQLEDAIRHWSADTLQSDVMDRAHGALRSMIVRLGDVAVKGLVDPRSVIDPFMTLVLELRAIVRADKRYDLSDLIRDRLGALSIEVRDTPSGVEWDLRTSES